MISRTFITSDLHLNHTNIMKYCPNSRKFNSIEEMNEKIISNWNKIISQDDMVYILGDVGFGSTEANTKILRRLNGTKILIVGNHDHRNLKDNDFRAEFSEVKDYAEMVFDKKFVVMSHYPFLYWNGSHRNSYMLHGHCHSKNPDKLPIRRYDVGLDGNDCMVYDLSELLKNIEKRLIPDSKTSHHEERY